MSGRFAVKMYRTKAGEIWSNVWCIHTPSGEVMFFTATRNARITCLNMAHQIAAEAVKAEFDGIVAANWDVVPGE